MKVQLKACADLDHNLSFQTHHVLSKKLCITCVVGWVAHHCTPTGTNKSTKKTKLFSFESFSGSKSQSSCTDFVLYRSHIELFLFSGFSWSLCEQMVAQINQESQTTPAIDISRYIISVMPSDHRHLHLQNLSLSILWYLNSPLKVHSAFLVSE